MLFTLDNLHKKFSLPGSVKLAEKNPLPRPQRQLSACYRDTDGGADQRRLDVGVGVSLTVGIIPLTGNERQQFVYDIPSYGWVSIFIDRDRRRRMRHVNAT